ncbi:hypothetical protein FPV67DRAFT_1677274 [Lyophyllum atratum]|nr:hypothetical protein FPV67DRAFT_1677274 [Lyophyllum atratum]
MKFSSALLIVLPVILTSWTVAAYPHQAESSVEAREFDEWEYLNVRDYDALNARRACKTSKDCLGMICINGVCQ